MNNNLITLEETNSVSSELFKSLRTNIQFALSPEQKTILITSAASGDGKSFVCSNLATTFTQIGKKVLIIDLDLRKRTQHKIFDISNTTGMSILLNDDNFKEGLDLDTILLKFIKTTIVKDLFVITAGPIPHNPSELLMNRNLEKLLSNFKTKFDYIFIDAPPVNIVTDTAIISRYVDGVILVASVGKTHVGILKDAKKTLEKCKANILGVVANRVPIHKRSYKYKGYEYEYNHSLTVDSKRNKRN
ncbi:MAG: CpsD/CapB family tyrosine-protein kinase [Clostridia bacterium]|nr:CpsD/CapB family tyrosine-protein kinase [Clostridia bacterium]MDD4386507.1 CpsD/CapB family tyrosine-protein kinase [Clostridia bacterium]